MFGIYDPQLDLGTLVKEIEQVTTIEGTKLSKRFTTTLTAWNEFQTLKQEDASSITAQVAESIRTGETKQLRALISEWRNHQTKNVHELERAVAPEILATLRGYYITDNGEYNYAAIAEQFDKKADRFTHLATTVDISAESNTLMGASEEARAAWIEAPIIAEDLTRLAPSLVLAARLAGKSLAMPGLNSDKEQIAATVVTAGLHRRRIFEAWDNKDHRAKRWGALFQMGATIKATPYPELTGYRAPEPMVTEYIPNQIGHQIVERDPEDLTAPLPA